MHASDDLQRGTPLHAQARPVGQRLGATAARSRASEEFGSPDRAVGSEKREHLERVARYYARQAGIEWGRSRFDIVNVVLTAIPRIELMRDAFRSGRTL